MNITRVAHTQAVIVSWKLQRVKSFCHCMCIVRLLPDTSPFNDCVCFCGREAETAKMKKRKTHEQKLTFTHLPFIMQKYASLYCTKIYLLKNLALSTHAQIHLIRISFALLTSFSLSSSLTASVTHPYRNYVEKLLARYEINKRNIHSYTDTHQIQT